MKNETGRYMVKLPAGSVNRDGEIPNGINGTGVLLVDDRGLIVKGQGDITITGMKDHVITATVEIVIGGFICEEEE